MTDTETEYENGLTVLNPDLLRLELIKPFLNDNDAKTELSDREIAGISALEALDMFLKDANGGGIPATMQFVSRFKDNRKSCNRKGMSERVQMLKQGSVLYGMNDRPLNEDMAAGKEEKRGGIMSRIFGRK